MDFLISEGKNFKPKGFSDLIQEKFPDDCKNYKNPFFPILCFPQVFQMMHIRKSDIQPTFCYRTDYKRDILVAHILSYDYEQHLHIPKVTTNSDDPLEYRCQTDRRVFTPEEHVQWASEQTHPLASFNEVDEHVKKLVEERKLGEKHVNQYRKHILERWKKRAKDLEADQKIWKDSLDPQVRKVIGHIHMPLWNEILSNIDTPDWRLCADITQGMPLTGDIPPSYLWKISDEPPAPNDIETFRAEGIGCKIPKAIRQEKELMNFMWDNVLEEVEGNTIIGPFHPCSLDTSTSLIAARHIVLQPDKQRPCDDFTKSQANGGCHLNERIKMITVDRFMNNCNYLKHNIDVADNTSFKCFKGDHAKAFRQCPIKPSNRELFRIAVPTKLTEQQYIFEHLGLPFGGIPCPQQYSRISDCIARICRQRLLLYVEAYIDDLFGIDPETTADFGWECFRELHRLLGIKLKESKTEGPADDQTILGLLCKFGTGPCSVNLTEERRQKTISKLQNFLKKKFVSASEASSFAGKMEFAQKGIFGRSVRPYLQPFYARAHHRCATWTKSLDWAIRWLLHLMINLKGNVLHEFGKEPKQYMLYADGRGSPDHGGWVIFDCENTKKANFSSFPLDDTMREFFKGSKMGIALVEAWSVLIGIQEANFDEGSLITAFIDNENALAFIRKGYSWDFRMTWIVSAIWNLCAQKNYRIYFRRVFTDSNIADAPSRSKNVKNEHPDFEWNEVESKNAQAPPGWQQLMYAKNARGGHDI